ncbi:hypothetical protein QWT87_03615 [Chryseobacterium sp. APV1]|uniref:XRE family transcriptional regulator n=1 Tax=Chryseobacterium urinae TaxID=3058400 RepID=A0ABT8U1E3_9FLAO|nr:hypothetical protein [Chryseobacterium sp. APV1]MDO3423965.1 hypothetical protein [Chryseobacterium sp. APV1]
MSDFFDRLDKYMEYKGFNDNKITVETGISNGLIGKARKRGGLSQENISKILNTYPDLDANWWFRGNGKMLISNEFSNENLVDWEKVIKSQHELLTLKDKEIVRLKNLNK